MRDLDNIKSVDTIRSATRENQSSLLFDWTRYAPCLRSDQTMSGKVIGIRSNAFKCVFFFGYTQILLSSGSARVEEFNVATYKQTYYLLDARGTGSCSWQGWDGTSTVAAVEQNLPSQDTPLMNLWKRIWQRSGLCGSRLFLLSAFTCFHEHVQNQSIQE